MNRRDYNNRVLRALINSDKIGCYDAAAEAINTQNGTNLCKGTISKRLSGHLSWPIEDVEALEDFAGVYPITKRMASRMEAADQNARDLMTAVASLAKETGEAVEAALSANDPEGDAKALKEAYESRDANQAVIDALEAKNKTIPFLGAVT